MATQTYGQRKRRPSTTQREPSSSEDDDAPPHTRPRTQTEKRAAEETEKSRKKGKRRAVQDMDEEDEEGSESEGEEGGAGKKGKKRALSNEETRELAQAMARFVLFHDFQHKPLRRDEIVKAVLTDGRGKYFNEILEKAQTLLAKVIGLELVLMLAKEAGAGKNPPKSFVLRSSLPAPLLHHAHTHPIPSLADSIRAQPDPFQPPSTRGGSVRRDKQLKEYSDWCGERESTLVDGRTAEWADYGLLGVVLALILVNGKVLGDDQLVSYLKRLRLAPSAPTPHSPLYAPAVLSLHAALQQYARMGYLERGKNAGVQPTQTQHPQTQRRKGRPTQTQAGATAGTAGAGLDESVVQEAGDASVEWRWGARAEIELGEKAVARFVQHIYEAGPAAGASSVRRTQLGTQVGEESEGQAQDEQPTNTGGRGGRGRTGEKLMKEIARAAGTKRLEDATGLGKKPRAEE